MSDNRHGMTWVRSPHHNKDGDLESWKRYMRLNYPNPLIGDIGKFVYTDRRTGQEKARGYLYEMGPYGPQWVGAKGKTKVEGKKGGELVDLSPAVVIKTEDERVIEKEAEKQRLVKIDAFYSYDYSQWSPKKRKLERTRLTKRGLIVPLDL